jgi:hypothetical protein
MKVPICRIAPMAALFVAVIATVPAHATTYVSFSGYTADHIDWVNLPYDSPISGSFSMPDEFIWDFTEPYDVPTVQFQADVTSFSAGGSSLTRVSSGPNATLLYAPSLLVPVVLFGEPLEPLPLQVVFGAVLDPALARLIQLGGDLS